MWGALPLRWLGWSAGGQRTTVRPSFPQQLCDKESKGEKELFFRGGFPNSILPERLLALVRPEFDLVLRRFEV